MKKIILLLTMLLMATSTSFASNIDNEQRVAVSLITINDLQNNESMNKTTRISDFNFDIITYDESGLRIKKQFSDNDWFDIKANPVKLHNKEIVYFTNCDSSGNYDIINIAYDSNSNNAIIYHDNMRNSSKNVLSIYLKNTSTDDILVIEIFDINLIFDNIPIASADEENGLKYWYAKVIKPVDSQEDTSSDEISLRATQLEHKNIAIHTKKYNIAGATVYHNMEVHRKLIYPSGFAGSSSENFFTIVVIDREWTRCYEIPSLNDDKGSLLQLDNVSVDVATDTYQVINSVTVDGIVKQNAKFGFKVAYNSSISLGKYISITATYTASKQFKDINVATKIMPSETRQSGVKIDSNDVLLGVGHYFGQAWIIGNKSSNPTGTKVFQTKFKYFVRSPYDETQSEWITKTDNVEYTLE